MQPLHIMVFLILFPLLLAVASLVVRPLSVRRIVAVPANVLIAGGSILLLASAGSEPIFFKVESSLVEHFILAAEVGMGLLVTYLGLSSKRYFIMLLGGVMTTMAVVFEFICPPAAHEVHHLFIDRFSVIMALVIGILGTLIINYGIGYMAEYHEHHKEVKDRRRFFGFLMYLFISSMFGLVFSNNLKWMFFFWEITTLCSFFLIGYRNDRESQDSAFRALWMNVLGGIAFSAGVAYLSLRTGILDLDRMILAGSPGVMIPAVLLAFAGLVKSAQMPFSTWLTGAMVAPTPVSALLHSSTMVKAGVYLLFKVSPILNDTPAGICITSIGAVTFLFTSFIAVSQSDSKRVLAYSTISTLALIVMCVGVGTYEAAWSALLLIIFHAVAKSLLFLCVGVIDYKLDSRDIEDMGFLMVRMPKVAAMMNIGIAGMFLAPFGMVISKAATLRALIDIHPLLGVPLAFGGGAITFFYTKWMGKTLMLKPAAENQEGAVSVWEWVTLVVLAFLTIAVCISFPLISSRLVDPYIASVYGASPTLEKATLILIVAIMTSLLVIFPIGVMYNSRRRDYRLVGPYLSGLNVDETSFAG
ncbi:MAG: NADH-quinone oxidoreductase subunit L, partial [Candidatus Hydrogenedentota bacterium]